MAGLRGQLATIVADAAQGDMTAVRAARSNTPTVVVAPIPILRELDEATRRAQHLGHELSALQQAHLAHVDKTSAQLREMRADKDALIEQVARLRAASEDDRATIKELRVVKTRHEATIERMRQDQGAQRENIDTETGARSISKRARDATAAPPKWSASILTREVAVNLHNPPRAFSILAMTSAELLTLSPHAKTHLWSERSGAVPDPEWDNLVALVIARHFTASGLDAPSWTQRVGLGKTRPGSWFQPTPATVRREHADPYLWRHRVKVRRDSIPLPQ